ncbi:hypothetical protein CHIBITOTORO_00320 [Serratia phage vB_SmaM-ChibiTotoro]|nr:hypothetical protein CHIBITOTORO_00320 [Serratia phage vB_SmaM-ChibiTotoro]
MKAVVKDDVIRALKIATGVDVSRGDLELIDRLIKAAKRKHRMASDVAKADRVQGPGVVEFGGIPVAFGQTKIDGAMISFAGRVNRPAPEAEVDTTAQQVEDLALSDGNCTSLPDCKCAHHQLAAAKLSGNDKVIACRCAVCVRHLTFMRNSLKSLTLRDDFDVIHGKLNVRVGLHDKDTCICADCAEKRKNSAPQ